MNLLLYIVSPVVSENTDALLSTNLRVISTSIIVGNLTPLPSKFASITVLYPETVSDEDRNKIDSEKKLFSDVVKAIVKIVKQRIENVLNPKEKDLKVSKVKSIITLDPNLFKIQN